MAFRLSRYEEKIAREHNMTPYDFAIHKKADTLLYEVMMKNVGLDEDEIAEKQRREDEARNRELRYSRRRIQKNLGSTCPECGADLMNCSGPYGSFVGCSNFPDCTYSRKFW